MADAASSLWSGIKSVGSSIGRGVGSLFGGGSSSMPNVASGLSGPTGQALAGTMGSTLPSLAQATAPIANVAGGAGGFGGAGGAISKIIGGGGDALADIGPSAASWTSPVRDALASIGEGASGGGASGGGASGGGVLGNVLGFAKTVGPIALLADTVMKGQRAAPGVNNLKEVLNTLPSAAEPMQNAALLNRGAIEAMQGNLPGGATMAIDSALQAAEAQIRSRYAELGISGSTMEGQDLADAARRAVGARFQIGQQMAATGFNAAAQAGALGRELTANQLRIYDMISQAETAQGTQLGDALARFAGLLPEERRAA